VVSELAVRGIDLKARVPSLEPDLWWEVELFEPNIKTADVLTAA
jgi:hypothetical protein